MNTCPYVYMYVCMYACMSWLFFDRELGVFKFKISLGVGECESAGVLSFLSASSTGQRFSSVIKIMSLKSLKPCHINPIHVIDGGFF